MDATQLGFLEIALNAKRVGIDQRKNTRAGIDVAARQQTEIRDNAVDRRQYRRTFEIELRNFERRVRRIELRLRNVDGLLIPLDLLGSYGKGRQALAARQIALVLIQRRQAARDLGLGLIERILKAPLIDAKKRLGLPHLLVVMNKHVTDES